MPSLLLTIPAEHWMSANDRMHWAQKAKRTAAVRQLAAAAARAGEWPRMMQVHVCAFVGYPSKRKADPPNAYPTVKAALDGFTDAGVWPDDDSEHVVAVEFRRDPTPAPKGTHTLRLVITDQALSF